MRRTKRRKKLLVYEAIIFIIASLFIIGLLAKYLIYRAAIPTEVTLKSAAFGTYWGLPEPLTTTAERFSLVIPYPDKAAKIPQIRASVQDIMLPFNAFYVKAGDTNVNPVPWETIQANGWQLTDITKVEYGQTFNFADPGAPGYAEAWAQAAILRAQESQANWVFADSITANLGWTFLPAERPAKYPNDDLWRQAMKLFLSVVSARVHDAGLKFGANMGIGNLPGTKPWHDEWLQFVDAPMEERFSFGRDTANDPIIDFSTTKIEQQIDVVQTLSKPAILVTPARQDDAEYDQHARFALAMYLIARKAEDWFIFYDSPGPSGGTMTYWHPDFEAAKSLGVIQSLPAKADNIWYRKYDKAIVLLNATDSIQTISPALGPEAAALGTLAPRTGVIVNLTLISPTPTSPTTTITVRLQGRTNFTENAQLKIFPAGTASSVFEKNDLVFDASGSTQITLPELTGASYDVELKLAYYLKVKLLNVAKTDLNNLDFGTLRGGDFNNDNTVNIDDFTYMINSWGDSDPVADINQDNEVNNADFTVINANWSMQGN